MKEIMKKYFAFAGIIIISCLVCGCRQTSEKSGDQPITVACYYFPDYHTGEPRNEAAKGQGWSEWELVKAARPRFEGHGQPKVPLWGYGDERDPSVMAQKIDAAADHGIDALIFDWYYYDDGPFLNKCLDEGFLKAPNTNRIQFSLMWANHDWFEIQPYTHGTEQQLLYQGRVTPETYEQICDHVVNKYFTQPNYWLIDGKPYFSVYDIQKFIENFGSLEETKKAMDQMRVKAIAAGLQGVHWNLVVWGNPILPGDNVPENVRDLLKILGFDSATSYVWIHHASLPESTNDYNKVRDEYINHWDKAEKEYGVPYFPNVTMGWDSSPRTDQSKDWQPNYGYPYTGIITNNTPENFRIALQMVKDRMLADVNSPRIFTINCWNEWTEGSYLEPDTLHGMQYLSAVKDVFGTNRATCFSRAQNTSSNLKLQHLTCEQTVMPSGIETSSPALGWQIVSDSRNVFQKAYQILVAGSSGQLAKNNGDCWDSGKVASENSIQVFYEGQPLQPATTYYWKARVWDQQGNGSDWSEPQTWQMGLLSADDWSDAQWIALQEPPAGQRIVPGIHGSGNPAMGDMKNILPLFRREFYVEKTLKKATAFISGLGHFEMYLNGKKAGDHFLDPGWTNYEKYALYVTFDITSYLNDGANACGLMLGNGFYHTPRERYLKCVVSHGFPKAICKIILEYTDGHQVEIVTDKSWKTTSSPISFSSIYGGETYDARYEQNGWDQAGFDDSRWQQALTVTGPPQLRSQTATPLKIMESFEPKEIFQSKTGEWVYDLGQNASGVICLNVRAKKGETVQVWPGELLDDNNVVYQQASGEPFWFEYTAAGRDEETWQPRFTYYGFRYLMLRNAVPEGAPNPENLPVATKLQGLHTRNATPQSGTFSCSNELFNKTFKLIDWSIRSNMASVLTDCPHREKLGWLEQAHLMGNSIQYNYNINRLYNKIIDDMSAAQLPDGMIPDIAPEIVVFEGGFRDSPEWGSAFVLLPWYLYKWYGDPRPLQTNYEGMKRYVAYLTSTADHHIVSHGLGDWFDLGPNTPGVSQLTSRGVTATAIYYYDVNIMRQTAKLLGKPDDVTYFTELAAKIKDAFNQKFFNAETMQYDTGSQAANAMAVFMNLAAPENRQAVFRNILRDLENRNYSLTPGDIGFRYLLRVLESEGASETIFTINNRNDVPGYGFQLAKGATALTESWAALRYVSNNHCMLGHLMEWFYSGLAGIRQTEGSVACKEIIIRPEPVGDITHASATYECPYGKIVSDWRIEGDKFCLNVEIPANTTALVYFPVKNIKGLIENNKKFRAKTMKDGAVKIGSGKYCFKIPF